jgi:hypothetical protein
MRKAVLRFGSLRKPLVLVVEAQPFRHRSTIKRKMKCNGEKATPGAFVTSNEQVDQAI